MRGRPCTICSRTDAAEIDAALMSGGKLIPTAARFGLTKSTLHYHKSKCLTPRIQAAARITRSTKEAKAEVTRAREIAAGATPSVEDVLSLHALLERVARSLDRLEGSAQVAAADGLHASLAALSGQLHRGVETAAKLQGLYSDAPQAQQQERFSITINLGEAPVTIDCTPNET